MYATRRAIALLLAAVLAAIAAAAMTAPRADAIPPAAHAAKAKPWTPLRRVYTLGRKMARNQCELHQAISRFMFQCQGVSKPYKARKGYPADCYVQSLARPDLSFCMLEYYGRAFAGHEWTCNRRVRYRYNGTAIRPVKLGSDKHWSCSDTSGAMSRVIATTARKPRFDPNIAWGAATFQAWTACNLRNHVTSDGRTDQACHVAWANNCIASRSLGRKHQGTCWLHMRIINDQGTKRRYYTCWKRQGYSMVTPYLVKRIYTGTYPRGGWACYRTAH